MLRLPLRWIALIAAAASCSMADVFLRERRDLPPGWTHAYQTEVILNHGKGLVQVLHADTGLLQVVDRLKKLYGDRFVGSASQEIAWGFVIEGEWVMRYFLQQDPEQGGTVITRVQQKRSEAGAPGADPTTHQLKEIPPLPGSEPTYFFKDADTLMAMEISTCRQTPSSALDTMESVLVQAGWQKGLPGEGGMLWYMKQDRLALVSAQKSDDGFTRVLRLHKPIGVK